MTEARELYDKIIKNDYCIGCGACASLKDSPFNIIMNEFGNLVAYPFKDPDKCQIEILSLCPFSNNALNENEISRIFFPEINNIDIHIGKFLNCYAGYVNEGCFREKGSSGGMAKWLGYILLKEDKIDYFIQVFPNRINNSHLPLFDYNIISDKNEVLQGSKSAYYPVSLVSILKRIKEVNGRYAITGVPCFIKALRLLAYSEKIYRDRIKFTIGIICGGMKSANQSKIIGWQLGVLPEYLIAIDFRRKHIDKPATNKIYQVWSSLDKKERYKDAAKIYATDWGSGFFKPNACDYCDDIVAETADVSFGDAWLPQFENDPKGTSIVIVRNQEISNILEKYCLNQTLTLYNLSVEDIKKSQEGGFRHRREALSFRIAKKEINKEWYPKKRVIANEFKISKRREKIYSLREEISKQSHISALNALKNNNLNIFYTEMNYLIRKYYIARHGNLLTRAIKKIIKIILNK